jgi:hypothetical protein
MAKVLSELERWRAWDKPAIPNRESTGTLYNQHSPSNTNPNPNLVPWDDILRPSESE